MFGQIPSYYNGLDLTKTGNDLFLELSVRISETHTSIPYTASTTDIWDACKLADEDPEISTNVLLIYGFNDDDGILDTDRTRSKDATDSGGGDVGTWNREHIFAKSLAIPVLNTDAPGPGTDVYNLKAADSERNTLRSNRKFTDGSGNSGIVSLNGGWYPGDEWKGDVARTVMYMYLRYHGDGTQVSETKCLPINIGFGETLSVDPNMIDLFLRWNVEDPVSDFEANHNDKLEGIQGNRNPFIDNPYLATIIWGGINAEDKWDMNSTSDTEAPSIPSNLVASNITDTSVEVSWDASTDNIGVYDYLIYLDDVYLQTSTTTSTTISGLSALTAYTIKIKARDASSNMSNLSEALNVTTIEGPIVLFEENFEDCSAIQFVTYSEASNKDWTCEVQYGENNSGSIGINGYGQDVLSKDWLITANAIDFDASSGEKLRFYTDAAYGTTPLELLYSNNYDGVSNPSDFTWISVPNVTIPVHSTGTSTEEVYILDDIDVSTINGSVYFAFKYYSDENPTRWTVDSFKLTATEIDTDSDNDGVDNEVDSCPGTPEGEVVDANGCSEGQRDDDNDGVANTIDICANTPVGETVDEQGCSSSQLDDDNDGIMNNVDICPNTPSGEVVDANGCSEGQLDDDNDGVANAIDICANTPVGETVDEQGCSSSQLDDDNDGIMNNIDICPDTPSGETVNTTGCAESQLDDDNDGIPNSIDQCPNTPDGDIVDSVGCTIFSLPFNNFTIETIGETCPDKNNGKIIISADASYNYTLTLNTAGSYNFTDTFTIENVPPGTYELCISIPEQNYEQCYVVTIAEGTVISAKSNTKSGKTYVSVEEGTAPYAAVVNGVELFETNQSSFEFNVKHGDLVEVKSAIDCEGVYSKVIELNDEIAAYPNPTNGLFQVYLPVHNESVKAEVFNNYSQRILTKQYQLNYDKITIDLSGYPSGIYLVKIYVNTPIVLKVIKN